MEFKQLNEYNLIESIAKYLTDKLDGLECGLVGKRSQRVLEQEAEASPNGKVFVAFMGNQRPEKIGQTRVWNYSTSILLTLIVKGIGIESERDFIKWKNEILINMINYGYQNVSLELGETGTEVYTPDGSNLAIGEMLFYYPSQLYT